MPGAVLAIDQRGEVSEAEGGQGCDREHEPDRRPMPTDPSPIAIVQQFDTSRAHAQSLTSSRPAQNEVKEGHNAKVDQKWCVPRLYYFSAHGDYGRLNT